MIEQIVPGIVAVISIFLVIHMSMAKSRSMARIERSFDQSIRVAQLERERNLELRDMFNVSEYEWHLLNEAAGEPDYHEQNKPLRRIVTDTSKYEADFEAGGHGIHMHLEAFERAMQKDMEDIRRHLGTPPPTTGRWQRPDWVKTEDTY